MWEKMEISLDTRNYLRGTHELWSRVSGGDLIFTVRPIGEIPGNDDGGYYSVSAALKIKGLMR